MLAYRRLVYWGYSLARWITRNSGAHRTFKKLLGPVAGRFVYSTLSRGDTPFEIQGNRMYLAPRGRYPSPDMVADNYEPATTKLFRELLSPGMTVVDIGANVGYFTLLAANEVSPGGKVLAIEPEAQNNLLLKKNVCINKLDNVFVSPKAVSNYTGFTTLFLSELDNGSHSLSDMGARGVAGRISVQTTTLDELLADYGWASVDLVKLDVEGAEMMVLEGMQGLLSGSSNLNLIIEFCPFLLNTTGVDPFKLLKVIQQWGFVIKVIDDDAGPILLDETKLTVMTRKLLELESYKNIWCTRV